MLVIECEQNTEEWERARLGIPTASDFSKILTGTGKPSSQIEDYAAHLAAETYHGATIGGFKGNRATERGHELEDEAADMYTFLRDYEVEKVGFCIEDSFPDKFGPSSIAGCSPDRFVRIPGRGQHPGLLEIKCLGASKHVLAHAYYAKNKRPEPGYVAQCQGQLLVTGRRWVDLYFYHPDLPELAIRVNRDEKYQSLLVAQINAVNERKSELLNLIQEAA